MLKLDIELLDNHGVVSASVAAAMALGAFDRSEADIAVAVTGVAGPDPDERGNPVGLVYLACARRAKSAFEKGLKTKVTVSDMEDWFSTRTYAETRAWAKVIVDEETDTILGAHIVGHAGEELINIFGLAKAHGITATQLRDFIYAYPSFSADIKHML